MFLMSYLSQIFWRQFWDVCTLILNDFSFLVCLSVCSLPHFLTEISVSMISPVVDELSFSNFLELFPDVFTLVTNNFRFLVYLSVFPLPYFLTKIRLTLDISSSRWVTPLKFSGDFPGMFVD